jgi:hypothetical protein
MEMEKEIYASFRDARIVEILKVEVNEGNGTEEDPIRRVAYYLNKSGKVLFHTTDKEREFAGGDEMLKVDEA